MGSQLSASLPQAPPSTAGWYTPASGRHPLGATKIEFRLRVLILVIVISLGFWAPWIEAWGIGSRIPLLEWLTLKLSRLGLVPFAVASPLMVAIAALIAALGAGLRVWGTAWLGAFTVNHHQMKAGAVLADGPYRYVRNPLYLGTWCMFAAMAFLMPTTGAVFAMAVVTAFLFRLILGEEAFLRSELGDSYLTYLRTVPRLLPLLRTPLAPTGRRPQWLRSVFSELNAIGVFVTFALLSWSYDNWLMTRAVIVSFGVSLLARAFMPAVRQQPAPAE